MKIRIQRCKDKIKVQEQWTIKDYIRAIIHYRRSQAAPILAAELLMEWFPMIKEVTINTELTENE